MSGPLNKCAFLFGTIIVFLRCSAKCERHRGHGIISDNVFRSFLQRNATSVRSLIHAKLCNTLHNFGPHESLEPGFSEAGDVAISAIDYIDEKFEGVYPHSGHCNSNGSCSTNP
jgi:hypothetical protein